MNLVKDSYDVRLTKIEAQTQADFYAAHIGIATWICGVSPFLIFSRQKAEMLLSTPELVRPSPKISKDTSSGNNVYREFVARRPIS
jgi:hypothetical protein